MKPTVLLVEDDENDVFFMKRAFQKCTVSLNLQIVGNGREALRYLQGEEEFSDRKRYPLPSLILLDLNIPYVTGIEVLRRLRQAPELHNLIVVVLTSSTIKTDMDIAYSLGVNSYLIKPIQVEDRVETVELLAKYWLQKNMVAFAVPRTPAE